MSGGRRQRPEVRPWQSLTGPQTSKVRPGDGVSLREPAQPRLRRSVRWGNLRLFALVRATRSYPQGRFPERSVASLVTEMKVSGVRSAPCTLKGKIIGRGVPGLFWSEDLVIQDDTGFVVLDYRPHTRAAVLDAYRQSHRRRACHGRRDRGVVVGFGDHAGDVATSCCTGEAKLRLGPIGAS